MDILEFTKKKVAEAIGKTPETAIPNQTKYSDEEVQQLALDLVKRKRTEQTYAALGDDYFSKIKGDIQALEVPEIKTTGGYYSRPVVDTSGVQDIQKRLMQLSSDVEYISHSLEGAEKKATEAATNLETVSAALKSAHDAYAASPTQEAAQAYNQAVSAFQNAKAGYDAAYESYKTAYDQYQKVSGKTDEVFSAWKKYVDGYNSGYDAWRSTVRDAAKVKAELDDVIAQLDAAEDSYRGFAAGNDFIDGIADGVLGYVDKHADQLFDIAHIPDKVQKVFDYRTGKADIEWLEQQREKLQEEYDWAVYSGLTDIRNTPYFGDLTRQDRLMLIDMSVINQMPETDRTLFESWLNYRGADARDEVKAFEKKYGKERLEELESSLRRYQNYQKAYDTKTKAQEGAQGILGGAGSSLLSIPASVWNAIQSPFAVAQELLWYDDRYGNLDPNGPGFQTGIWAGTVVDTVGKNIAGDVYDEKGELIEDGGWLRQGLSTLYGAGMSAANNLARLGIGIATGGGASVTLGLAAMGSFGDTVRQISEQGGSPAQALAMGIINGGLEVLTEKYSVENILKVAKGDPLNFGKVVKEMLKQGGIEASEEEINFLASTLAEGAIMQDKSAYNLQVQKLMGDGLSEAEARERANYSLIQQAVDTAVQSVLSGGMMTGTTNIVNSLQYSSVGNKLGLGKVTIEQAREIIDSGLESAENTEAYQMALKLQKKLDAGKIPTKGELAQQLMANEQAIQAEGKDDAAAMQTTNAISNPLSSYSAEKQSTIRSYINAVDNKIKGFVQSVKSGDLTFKRQKISDVSARAATDIGKLLGVDVRGYTHNINTNGIRHILIRHGVNGQHDNTMSADEDIARVGWVLENYDNVELLTENGEQIHSSEFRDQNNDTAPQIRFIKKIDGTYYVVEAAFENDYKKLWVQSAYLTKKEDVTQVPAEGQQANHETNARSALASPSSKTIIDQGGGIVNQNNQNGGNANGTTETEFATKRGNRSTGTADEAIAGREFAGASVSSGSQGRDAGTGTGEQSGIVARSASSGQAADRARAFAQRENRINAVRDKVASSPASFGIRNGSNNETMKLIPVGLQDESLRNIDNWFDQHGIRAYFYTGLLEIKRPDGSYFVTPGVLQGDEVFIQADNIQLMSEQIAKHEAFHVLRRENPGLVQRLAEDLRSRYTEAEFDAIVEKYIKRYGGVIDMSSEDAIWKIWEEILADAYAGIDPRKAGVTKYAETAQELTNKFTGERGNLQSNGTRQTNGPNSQAVENQEPQYVIAEIKGKLEDYGIGVFLNTNIFDGVKPRDWGTVLGKYVYKNLAGTEMTMYDESGNSEVVRLARINDRTRKDGAKNSHKVIDKIARYNGDNIKALATVHLSEMLQTSGNEDRSSENSHKWLDENGWIYRTTYLMDRTGTIYEATLNIADGRNGKILYDINKIRRIDAGVVPSTDDGRGSLRTINSSVESIPDPYAKVKSDHFVEETNYLLDPEELKDVPWYEPGMKETTVGPEQLPGKIESSRDAMRAADAMRDARQDRERAMNIPKEEFDGTDHLKFLGVKVENSVGDYWGISQAVAQDKAAKQLKNQIRRAEARLAPTEAEKEFAAGIAAGKYYPEDIPGRMDYEVVTELADYYQAEKSMDTHLLREKKTGIAARLQEDMQTLFKDSDAFTPSKARTLNYRTPERNMLEIFGNERGKAINDAIFSAVAVNEAERYRFINRMFDEVRTFEDSKGNKRELTKEERALTMILMEGNAASEIAAEMENAGSIRNAAQNIKNGEDPGDAAIEWGLSSEERKLAERIAQWMGAKETMGSDNADADIVEMAARKYGDQFNKFYDAINDFLVAHGYETIGFIRGYAPHLQSEKTQTTMKKVFHRLGIDADVVELPTNIAGMTADFKPNKRWNPHMQHRRGDKTQYDIAKAYESYVEYMSDILYHTDDIMRVRQAVNYFRREYAPEEIKNMLEWAEELRYARNPEQKAAFLRAHGALSNTSILSKEDIDERFNSFIDDEYKKIENAGKYSEFVKYLDNYANILAGKQSARDRGAEANGRAEMSRGNRLVQMFGRSQVAGSISSALNQSAQLPQIIAEIGAKNTSKAAWDIARGKLRKAAWAQESDFLIGKSGINFLVTDPGEMILSGMFKPAEFVDGFISTLAVRGEYLKQVEAGKSHREAIKLADKKGAAIMGSRMKGSKPVAFHAKNLMDSMINVFQVEALNSWEHIFQDLPRDFKEVAAQQGKKAAAGALAGVVIKYLIAAFLLNRLSEELYGGTPAPFDLFGLTANFIASGEGLTTNEYLRTVIDNAWEKMAGNRPFETDPTALDEDFKTGEAIADTAYNVANDVPFLRNVAAVMGVGDGTLPIPDIGGAAVRIASNAVEGNFERIPEEVFGLAMDFVPGGRQLEKTAQGLETVVRGGRYTGYGDSKKLQYPVEQNFENVVGGILFGRNGLDATDNFYSSGESALSAKQSVLYKQLVDEGADGAEIYTAIQKWRGLNSDEDLTSYARAVKQRDLIRELDISDSMKLEMYRELTGAESRADKFAELLNVGLDWDEVMDAYDEYCFQDSQDNLTATQKATKFRHWVDSRHFTEEQADKIADTMKFYSIVPSKAGQYEKLIESGLNSEDAMELIEDLNQLEPEEGKAHVTDVQKWRTCVDSFGVPMYQLAALASYMTDAQFKKAQTADDFGVDLNDFVRLHEIRAEYDANENGSFSRVEYEKAIDSLRLGTNDSAVLWQLFTGSKSAKNNPYSASVGQKVIDSLAE